MRRFFLSVALALVLPVLGWAQSAQDAIRGVIDSQMQAFQQDDFDTAFTFASPSIQGIFRTPETFGEMVRGGYPMVWRPADVRFGPLELRNGKRFQSVIVRDQAGTTHYFDYEMIESGGEWKINGVFRAQPPAIGA